MADLRLPPGPDELLEAVRTPLGRAFGGEQNLRLGGGTALAARWRHRHSTDVDLFVEPEPYRNFRWNTGGRFTLDLAVADPVDRLIIADDGTYITFHGRPGHITVDVARGLPFDPRSSDTARGTQVPLETTDEILAKKLLFRMARDKELLPRDLYDIAVAHQRDPTALQTALDALGNDQLAEILEVFKDHPTRARPRDHSPILAPSDPGLSERSPAIVERLLRDALLHRPPDRGPGLELNR